jgi:hypothetical protein
LIGPTVLSLFQFVGSESININVLAKTVIDRAGRRHDKVNFNINW